MLETGFSVNKRGKPSGVVIAKNKALLNSLKSKVKFWGFEVRRRASSYDAGFVKTAFAKTKPESESKSEKHKSGKTAFIPTH